ncbi:MAG: GNAT family N-acetyltransferase [Actinophytocola sp.]|uniref:GNAT family N-acetyltransferase n=1 Tax=Actinophytocola sp. TaxID=1872138 RepID=UPI003D6A1B73
MRIQILPYDHADSVALIAQVQQEYLVRYGAEDLTPVDPAEFAPPLGLFLVAYLDDRPVACGGWRVHNGPDGPEAELKRMYVAPAARGRGVARAVLAELERTAVEAGYRRMVLETGIHQPEAIALYTSAGYLEVPSFGYYANVPEAVHMGKTIVKEPSCPPMR